MSAVGTEAGPQARILRYGSSSLRRRAQEADPEAGETRDLLDELWGILADDGGVGLAAPQIGVSRRVIVIRHPERSPANQRIDLVNPVIEEAFGEAELFEEGCLSFPGLYAEILRPRGVKFSYHDRAGRSQRVRDDGLLARIVQHEVDHLDGTLFIDHFSVWQKIRYGPRLLLILLGRLLAETRIRK